MKDLERKNLKICRGLRHRSSNRKSLLVKEINTVLRKNVTRRLRRSKKTLMNKPKMKENIQGRNCLVSFKRSKLPQQRVSQMMSKMTKTTWQPKSKSKQLQNQKTKRKGKKNQKEKIEKHQKRKAKKLQKRLKMRKSQNAKSLPRWTKQVKHLQK